VRAIDPEHTEVTTETAHTRPDGYVVVHHTITPRDRNGQRLGPGHADAFAVSLPAGGSLEGRVEDNLDGTYTATTVQEPDAETTGIVVAPQERPAAAPPTAGGRKEPRKTTAAALGLVALVLLAFWGWSKDLFVVLFCAILVFDVWFFLIRPTQPLRERAGTLLQVLGVYSFAFGVLAKTGVLEGLAMEEDMTSPNLFEFLRGNFYAMGMLTHTLAIMLEPGRTSFSALAPLEPFAVLVFSLLGLVYTFFHLLVVMPLSYVAYVVADLPVQAVINSAVDTERSRSRRRSRRTPLS
jgi:hypothetical protein